MRTRIFYRIVFLLLLPAILSLHSTEGFSQVPDPPKVGVLLEPSEPVQITLEKPGRLLIRVNVPKDHHAYLDKGDLGVLIPVSVDVDALRQAGIAVRQTGAPSGERDDQIRATIFRGDGVFDFELNGTSQLAEGTARYPVTVTSQLCREKAPRICYAPSRQTVEIEVVHAGEGKEPPQGSLPVAGGSGSIQAGSLTLWHRAGTTR